MGKARRVRLARKVARNNGIDPNVFVRQINAESGFRTGLTSPQGAQGIAQFIPSTAAAYGVNLHDGKIRDDLRGAAKYMAHNLKATGGNYAKALSIYNSGSPTGYQHIAETRAYVDKILHGSNPHYAGSPSKSGGGSTTRRTTTTVPDTAARDATRRAAALAYHNDSTRPDALLNLALAVNSADQTKTNTTVTRTKTRAPSSDVGRLGASPPPRELRHVKGTDTFEGKTVAAWIVPVLKYARAHGWKGAVNSGYRSYAQQKAIYDSGVRPAAVPGTSNHEGDVFPRGAVDVSNAAQLSTILRGSPYRHLLQYAGAKDPVHFSHPHNGSY